MDEDKEREEKALENVKGMDLEDFTEEHILGRTTSIEIKNLVVSPLPSTKVAVGDADSLQRIAVNRTDIEAAIWNEAEIALLLRNRNEQITFKPEVHPASALFFSPQQKYARKSIFDLGERIWEGDFSPVQFTKRTLVKFLKTYGLKTPEEVQKAIRQMSVSEVFKQDSIMLDEESDNEKRIEEESETTNLPKNFKVFLPLTGETYAELAFEARVIKLKEDWGKDTPRRGIELRCTNARKVLQDMMKETLDKLPKDIPRYYGKLEIDRR